MSMEDRLSRWTILDFVEAVATRSEGFARQAGIGGMETAGNIMSYLADHPEDIEPFMNGGIFELPMDWFERGRLTWHAANGQVVRPQVARRQRIINRMKKGIPV